jgi:hypothetical protein
MATKIHQADQVFETPVLQLPDPNNGFEIREKQFHISQVFLAFEIMIQRLIVEF